MKEVKGYRQIQNTELKELGAWGTELVHERSGARICCIENPQDANKVFAISFCTPPCDDTGTPHILEHSVFCGSEKFPLKDPFMELAKGSVNTFLNAMTFSDKTMYPVASQNLQDLYHLMDVYFDAVFHPNILHDPRILMQEGWHYELTDPAEEIHIKGVVYNEMKGAFSAPESVLDLEIGRGLYPDTPYRFESGGAPEAIPQLDQDGFLRFYRKYYHPSNSYIYLYGDMPMEEVLQWMDRAYLCEYTAKEGYTVENFLPRQKPFSAPRRVNAPFSVSQDHEAEEGFLSYTFGIEPENAVDCFGLDLLEYMLLEAQGAPLKRALQKAGLGKDIYGDTTTRAFQGDFSIVAKGADIRREEEFQRVIFDTLASLAEEGFSERQKLSAINRLEFHLREGEYGTTPAGLVIYCQYVMNSWLYGADPFLYLRYDEIMGQIRKEAERGLFERLIRKYLLHNTYGLSVTLYPQADLSLQQDRELQQKLACYKESLSEEETRHLVQQTQELLAYQEAEDEEEAKRIVPHLSLCDIKREAEAIETEFFRLGQIPCWFVPASCSQILYLKAYWDLSGLPLRLYPYASILASVLGRMDTEHFTYEDLSSEIHICTGGMSVSVNVLERMDHSFRVEMQVDAKSLASESEVMTSLVLEILRTTKLEDEKRLREILDEEYSQMESEMDEAGHAIALQRAMAGLSKAALAGQYLSGVDYFLFIKELLHHFEERKEELIASLNEVRDRVFLQSGMELAGGSTAENRSALVKCMEDLYRGFPAEQTAYEKDSPVFCPTPHKEGIITPGQVQYVVQAGMFQAPYTGSMLVARQILGLDYLWNRLRVQGGAYGAFAGFTRLGSLYFASYRDPNLSTTLQAYQDVVDYLKDFCCDEKDLEKFIIGTIGGMDIPLTPALRIRTGISRSRTGQTQDMAQKVREEVLGTTVQSIQSLAEVVQKALCHSSICVVGSKEMITREKGVFDDIFEVL